MTAIELYEGNWRLLVAAIFKITRKDLADAKRARDARRFACSRWAEELFDFLGRNQEVVLKTWEITR